MPSAHQEVGVHDSVKISAVSLLKCVRVVMVNTNENVFSSVD